MVREPWVLPHTTKSPLGCLTALSIGAGPVPCPGLPSEMQRQALSLLPILPLTLVLADTGPDFLLPCLPHRCALSHINCKIELKILNCMHINVMFISTNKYTALSYAMLCQSTRSRGCSDPAHTAIAGVNSKIYQ